MSRAARVQVRRTERGQALLIMMLLVVVGGAALLLDGLSSAAGRRSAQDAQTARALADAKAALIAWALSHPRAPGRLPFPDRGSDAAGFDGLSDCVPTGTTVAGYDVEAANLHVIGQFPWRGDDAPGSGCAFTIDDWPLSRPLLDGSGAPLWYAVSDKLVFNGNGGPINVGLLDDTTPGNWLTVRDAQGNIVNDQVAAVIIAPGEALAAQDRGLATGNTRYPAQFLDAVTVGAVVHSNAPTDADGDSLFLHDGEFVMFPDHSEPLVDFNDRLVYITAQELLRAAERRVLAEVAAALRAYRQANLAYPPLSPFVNPFSEVPTGPGGIYAPAQLPLVAPAAFADGVPGTRIGHLATRNEGDVGDVFDTGFTIDWTAGDGAVSTFGTDSMADGSFEMDPADNGVMEANAAAALAAGTHTLAMLSAASGGDPACRWQGDVAIADCVGTVTVPVPAGYSVDLLFLGVIAFPDQTVMRTFSFDVVFQGAATTTTGNGARLRDVDSGAIFATPPARPAPAPPWRVTTVTITDSVAAVPGINVTRQLTLVDGSTGTVDITGIYSEPSSAGGTLAGDLPDWFADEQWDRFVLVEYAGNALPLESMATGTACTPGANCVILQTLDPADNVVETRDDAFAVVIGAGQQIVRPSPPNPPSEALVQDRYDGGAAPADFFEGRNSDALTGTAERRFLFVPVFNDQVRIVEPPPVP